MRKILTISVATYNLGTMIEDNLNSFTNLKNIDDVEVLVVDDGSTDNTTELAQKYQDKFPNSVKIIKQPNGGPGSTVNTGIKNATGLYFKMVDGDDWINTEELDKLLDILKETEEVDAIITNDLVYSECDKTIKKSIRFNYEKNKVFNGLSIERPLIGMHSTAFRTDILKENNITLDNGFYTDVEYLLYPIPFIKKIIYFDMDIYVYRVGREGQSVSYTSLKKNMHMHDLVLENIIKYYEENNEKLNECNLHFMEKRISDMILTKINLLLLFEDNSRKAVKEFIKELETKTNNIYKTCLQSWKVKLLVYSNYYLAKIYAIIMKRKANIK